MSSKIMSKVYLWMSIGLAITFITGSMVANNPDALVAIFSNYTPLVLAIAEIVVVIYLSARVAKMKPTTAKVLFIVYSILTGLTFSVIFLVYNISSIMTVFLATALIMFVFAFIGTVTEMDLSKIGTYLFMALIGIIIVSIINIFVGSSSLELAVSIVALIVFVIYIAYDVQNIKYLSETEIPEDNLAIYGALQLYLDFINIFIRLLSLFGKEK